MKKITYIILFLPVFLYSQPSWLWSKHLGSNYSSYAERPNSVIYDGMDTYVIGSYGGAMSITGGSTITANGINDIFIVKYDQSGNVVWEKTIGSNFNQPYAYEDAMGVYDPVNNCIYIAGEIVGTVAFPPFTLNGSQDNKDIFIARMNLNGTFIWAKTMGYPGSFGTGNDNAKVFIEPDGDVFLTGLVTGTTNFDSFAVPAGGFFARYDSNGNCKWAAHKYDNASYFYTTVAFIGTDIVMAGNFKSNPSHIDTVNLVPKGSQDGFVTRMDSAGHVIWLNKFGGIKSDYVATVCVDSSNHIFIAGTFNDTITISGHSVSNSTADNFFAKLDQNGNAIWVKQTHSTGSVSWIASMTSDGIGNCYVNGAFSGNATFGSFNLSTTNSSDMFVGRFDSSGTWLGVTNFGDGGAMGLAVDNSGSVYCSGVFDSTVNIGSTTFTSYDPQDIFFAKLGAITGVSSAHKPINQNQLIIFANPNKGTFNIKVPEEVHDLTGATLVVNDNNGKEVTRFELGGVNNNNSTPHFDVTNAAEGAYTVKLITKEKKTYIGKLVVE